MSGKLKSGGENDNNKRKSNERVITPEFSSRIMAGLQGMLREIH